MSSIVTDATIKFFLISVKLPSKSFMFHVFCILNENINEAVSDSTELKTIEIEAKKEANTKPKKEKVKKSETNLKPGKINLKPRLKCDLCSYTIPPELVKNGVNSLGNHIAVCSKRKEFRCTDCRDNQFSEKEALIEHIKIVHERVVQYMDFKCAYCDMSFGSEGAMVNHVKKFHNFKENSCDKCGIVLEDDMMNLCQLCNLQSVVVIDPFDDKLVLIGIQQTY